MIFFMKMNPALNFNNLACCLTNFTEGGAVTLYAKLFYILYLFALFLELNFLKNLATQNNNKTAQKTCNQSKT